MPASYNHQERVFRLDTPIPPISLALQTRRDFWGGSTAAPLSRMGASSPPERESGDAGEQSLGAGLLL